MPQQLTMGFDLGDRIRISSPVWPNHQLEVQPGDLSTFVPKGNGVYGYQAPKMANPILCAPIHEASGGVIYFDNKITLGDLESLLCVLEVRTGVRNKDYAVFIAESKQPGKDRFLTQMRVVSKFGLRFLFGALTESEYDGFPEQELTVLESLWLFLEQERKRWGTHFWEDGEKGLQGLFGGDGDYAREELSFGFMLENSYNQICRIWSRAWLVTK